MVRERIWRATMFDGSPEFRRTGWADSAKCENGFGAASAALAGSRVLNKGCLADDLKMDLAWQSPCPEGVRISRKEAGLMV